MRAALRLVSGLSAAANMVLTCLDSDSHLTARATQHGPITSICAVALALIFARLQFQRQLTLALLVPWLPLPRLLLPLIIMTDRCNWKFDSSENAISAALQCKIVSLDHDIM